MNALSDVDFSEAAFLRRQLAATQARLDAEIQRCGKAEGALAVVSESNATLLKSLKTSRAYAFDLERKIDRLLNGDDDAPRYDTEEEAGR